MFAALEKYCHYDLRIVAGSKPHEPAIVLVVVFAEQPGLAEIVGNSLRAAGLAGELHAFDARGGSSAAFIDHAIHTGDDGGDAFRPKLGAPRFGCRRCLHQMRFVPSPSARDAPDGRSQLERRYRDCTLSDGY